MRRLLMVLSLCLLPSLARAEPKSLGQLCGQLIGTQVTQCMGAARGQYLDQNAAGVCSQLIGTQVISCVSTIAGKGYRPDELGACSQLIGTQVIDCLGQTGRPFVERRPQPQPYPQQYPPPQPPPQPYPQQYPPRPAEGYCGQRSLGDVRAEIAAALEALRSGDPRSADRRLRRLLDNLR